MSNFGEKLKFIRTSRLNLNRPEFAHKVDINEATIRVWENSGTKMRQDNVEKLKTSLTKMLKEVDILWLFEEETHDSSSKTCTELSAASRAFNEEKKKKAKAERFHCVLQDARHEPVFKEKTKLLLEPAHLNDLECPCFVALKEDQTKIVIGFAHQISDQNYVMHLYYDKTHTVHVLTEKDTLYAVINIIQEK
jgi:hypothetical protein